MLSLAFVRDAEDLVFYGQTGRGKTHMATALGIAATSAGRPARFRRTAQLVLQLVFGQVKVSEMVKGAFRFGKRKFSEMVRPTGRAPTPAPPTVRTSYR